MHNYLKYVTKTIALVNCTSREAMCTKAICSGVSINTLDWYPWSTSWSIHYTWSTSRSILGQHSFDTWSTFGLMYVKVSRVSTNLHELIISWLSTDCQLRCQWSVYWVSTRVSMKCWSIINRRSVHGGYRLRVTSHIRSWNAFSTHDPIYLKNCIHSTVCHLIYTTLPSLDITWVQVVWLKRRVIKYS